MLTNSEIKTGIRYLTMYAKDIDNDFLEEIFNNGIDVNYQQNKAELIEECDNAFNKIADLVGDHIRNNLNASRTIKDVIDDFCTGDLLFNYKSEIVEIINKTIEEFEVKGEYDLDDLVDEIVLDLANHLTDRVIDDFNDHYESYGAVYEFENNDYHILYNTEDNSLIVLKSKYIGKFDLASPCFPNGCYNSPNINGLKAYRLKKEDYSEDFRIEQEESEEYLTWEE